MVSRQGHGRPNPTWLPVGHEVVRRLAAAVGGNPGGTWGEIFGMPMTAHFLGGCVIGASLGDGVIDHFHRAFSYPGLHVVDGSAMPANPGANPALTITALAERAFSYWPNKASPTRDHPWPWRDDGETQGSERRPVPVACRYRHYGPSYRLGPAGIQARLKGWPGPVD